VQAEIVLEESDTVCELQLIRKAAAFSEALPCDRIVFSRGYGDLWDKEEKLDSDILEFANVAEALINAEVQARVEELAAEESKRKAITLPGDGVPNERPAYYTNHHYDTADVMSSVFCNISNDTEFDQDKAMWVAFAMKHLLRAGLKGSAEVDLVKAYSYLRKALTDEF